MYQLIFKISVIILMCRGLLLSAPLIVIEDYSKSVNFSGKSVVLINKGDNTLYRDLGYDDREWKILSLPSSWDSLYHEWTGVCWYRLHVRFPEKLPDTSLGISSGLFRLCG